MKKCTMCDRMEPDHKNNCSACGGYLMPVREEKDVSKTNGNAQQQGTKCSACGKMNYSGRTHCVDCGVELNKTSTMAFTPQQDVLEAHPTCLLVSFLVLIWNIYMAYIITDNSLHPIIPRIVDMDSGLPEIFAFAAWGGAIFSFIIFCGLCGKMRWAGKMAFFQFAVPSLILSMAEIIDLLFRNDTGFSLNIHNRLYLWGVVAVIVLLGSCVSRYYGSHLDDMYDVESGDE